MRKKIIGRLVLCIFLLSTQQKIQASQSPWYKNGWKVAAAGWGTSASIFFSVGIYAYAKYKKFDSALLLGPKDREILKIARVAAPCLLAASAACALTATILYRYSTNQK